MKKYIKNFKYLKIPKHSKYLKDNGGPIYWLWAQIMEKKKNNYNNNNKHKNEWEVKYTGKIRTDHEIN